MRQSYSVSSALFTVFVLIYNAFLSLQWMYSVVVYIDLARRDFSPVVGDQQSSGCWSREN